jgi:excisionase family DNA binding protein
MVSQAPKYMTIAEAADYMRMPEWKLRNNWKRWGIPASKTGRSLLFRQDHLISFLESQRVA